MIPYLCSNISFILCKELHLSRSMWYWILVTPHNNLFGLSSLLDYFFFANLECWFKYHFPSQYEFKLKNIKKKKVNIVISTDFVKVILLKRRKVSLVKCDFIWIISFCLFTSVTCQPMCFCVVTEKRVVMGWEYDLGDAGSHLQVGPPDGIKSKPNNQSACNQLNEILTFVFLLTGFSMSHMMPKTWRSSVI